MRVRLPHIGEGRVFLPREFVENVWNVFGRHCEIAEHVIEVVGGVLVDHTPGRRRVLGAEIGLIEDSRDFLLVVRFGVVLDDQNRLVSHEIEPSR